MPHPVRQMRLRKQRREQTEEAFSSHAEGAEARVNNHKENTMTASPSDEAVSAAPTQGASVRLHKILADHGLGSRRGLEDLIREGKITVNGEVAKIGQTVLATDTICIEGQPVALNFSMPTFPRVLMYHKPTGEIVSRDDPEGRADVFERLPVIPHGRWISVGRLDLNSEGLLLFTDSGELAHRLMHPRHDIEREYAVRVWGTLTGEQCRKLLQGIELEDGIARVISLKDQGGEGANHWYHIVLKEGRYREVRRLFAALELTVSRLIRVRYACLAMPSTLKRGELEELSEDSINRLMRTVGLFPSNFASKSAGVGQEGKVAMQPAQRPRFDRDQRAPREDHRPRAATSDRYPARDTQRPASSHPRDAREPRSFNNNRGAEQQPRRHDENDVHLQGGGGRHPFKRYSQKRVISNQRGEFDPAVSSDAVQRAPYPNASRGERPARPSRPPYPSQREALTSPAQPVSAARQIELDEDALLQQRYAEQERRGELRGLAGQTLSVRAPRSVDGNSNSYGHRPAPSSPYQRGRREGSAPEGDRQPRRYPSDTNRGGQRSSQGQGFPPRAHAPHSDQRRSGGQYPSSYRGARQESDPQQGQGNYDKPPHRFEKKGFKKD